MKISYDPKADAINIKFQDGKYDVSEEVATGIIADMTKDGKIISIEILDVSRRMPKESASNVIVAMPTS